MHYIPGLIKSVVPAMLAFYLVLAGIYLVLRMLGKSPVRFPVFPRLALNKKQHRAGVDFEQFVVDRFDPGHFRRVHRQYKSAAGDVPAGEPEQSVLEYQALIHAQVIPFAVACIWKQRFTGGVLDFSDSDPFVIYRKISVEKDILVFVLIGIGGTESEPHDCYIVPMDAIRPEFAYLSKNFLDGYRRPQADAVLFLDTDKMLLR